MTQLALREMVVRLGFSQDAADDIFNAKGIESIDEWLNLDNEYVNTLYWNVKTLVVVNMLR